MTSTERPDEQGIDFAAYMKNFVPTAAPAELWTKISADAIVLVGRAGPMTKLRVNADLSVLANMASHLFERGRPVTLEEALSVEAEISFDAHLQATSPDSRHRQNQRSRLRRLREIHAGGGPRKPNRTTEERVGAMVSHRLVEDLARVEGVAVDSDDDRVGAFRAAVAFARAHRGSGPAATSSFERAKAWAFAADQGLELTARRLNIIVTHEVLRRPEPVALLALTYQLTKNDFEFGMTEALDLEPVPTAAQARALRGTSEP
ncbi:MAG: hypothetical protein EOO27_05215 [Comamonadaceae bacterium]|nr:MAG: hypothetical protein EOO27_05215 [Comamonadaceae bacterium]